MEPPETHRYLGSGVGASRRRIGLFSALLTLGLAYVAAFVFFVLRSEDFVAVEIDARASAYAKAHPVAPGTRLLFTPGSADLALLGRGWHEADIWGVWSSDRGAVIFLASTGHEPLVVEFDLLALIPRRRGDVTVSLSADGREIGRRRFTRDHPVTAARVALPGAVPVGEPVRLCFKIDAMTIPAHDGVSADLRQLGIYLRELVVGEP